MAMLQRMRRDWCAAGARAVVETDRDNEASQRGLEKAGFRCIGEVRTTVLCGVLLACRCSRGSQNRAGTCGEDGL